MNPQPDSDLPEIASAIPHRGPMLLVDEVVSLDESSIVCRKTFSQDEFFFQGHYPGFPLTPGVILCECAAQTGAILLSGKVSADEGIPVLTKMDKVRFKEIVYPGQTIEIACQLDDQLANAFYLTAKVTCQGKTAARLSFVCTIANPGNN
ncbi:MAG: beta-hydroxyacyl-ACP dehydratase [Mariniblastus sp.]|nr:beta-hydroxyacyl-ACP dehydratase [Mariniblastus sp.]